jgi:carbon storage regulator
MLVLTRKTNQSIMIGDEVEITILSVAGDKVRIGIDAPRDIAVFRKEVYVAIDQGAAPEDESATTNVADDLDGLR